MADFLSIGTRVKVLASGGQTGTIAEIRRQPMPHGMGGFRHVYIIKVDDGDVREVPIRRVVKETIDG